MIKRFIVAAAAALVASMAMSAQTVKTDSADGKQPTREAKAKFLKKCIRNITPAACNAPAEARVQKQ
jgi:hypothetical protein